MTNGIPQRGTRRSPSWETYFYQVSGEGTRTSSTIVDSVSSGQFGVRVRGLRRERGLSLEALASRSGVSRAMLSKVERGEKTPTLVVAAKVAEGLDVTLSQLVGVEEQREVVVVPR